MLITAAGAFAQVPNLTASTATPLAGYGHSYIAAKLPTGKSALNAFGGAMSEFVNPATGALSWRICATPPQGRQLSIPFCFSYDSAGVHHLENNAPGQLAWNSNASYLAQGGWTYSLPQLSEVTRQDVNGSYVCDYATDYMFQDGEGGRHALHLSVAGPAPGAPANSCAQTRPTRPGVSTGGEGAILATTTQPGGAFALTPVTVTAADGTRYFFNHPGKRAGVNGFASELPDVIEDRNGNEITLADSGSGNVAATDIVGRTLIDTSSFGRASGDDVAISGESEPYMVDWGTAASNYAVMVKPEQGTCSVPNTISGSEPVITAIELPDGESFQFQYDATYGLLDRVTFPGGGYVRYVWGVTYGEAEGGQFASSDGSCLDRYGEPAITARYVSLDGATEALDQSFEYATTWPAGGATWTGKTTTVTNHDQVRGTSFVTAYAYAGYTVPFQPNDDTSSTLQLPVEATITAKDWNGATLRTTTETWNNPRELATKTVAESNGEVDERAYSYDANEQQTENDEYGYGSGAPGALARVTLHAYGCAPGVHVVDRPTLVEIESGSRVRTAETDYAYDQSALTASGASDGRDPAYAAGGGITARCNLTTLTKYNYTGDIAETFTYDDAGNRLTHTDGNGNTTSFSYSPSLQAAYLTGITLPDTSTGGKTIEHSLTMAYDSASGQVISRTDVQNATTTSYTYDDPLDRLTEQNNPDGGKITYAYTANSLETKKLLTASYWTDQFNHWDGLGNADRSLTWNGTTWDTTDTAFDGEQLPLYVSYPYASSGMNSTKATSNAADPGATTAFDALGRPTEVAHSDGAAITISWSGPDRTITDAAGRAREEYYNALAQLAEVKEFTDSKGDGYATYYGYGSLDDLKTVTQGSETRTFDYDNLNRLMDATNPESGTVDYQYDNDGNLIEQTDANGTVVHYGYDALNRLRTRSYTVSGSTAATHAVEIDYDTDSTGAGTDYAYGRMTRVISGATSIGMDQYGPMGRLETYATTAGGNTYTTSMRFDDLGDPVWEKLPDGRSIGMSTGYEGRASLLKDDSAGYDYLHYRTYSPAGALAEEEFGNGLVEDVAYNSRLQPIGITVKDPNDQSDNTWKMNLAIAYTKTGVQTADNGNVVAVTDNLGNAGQEYTMGYDQLNQLLSWTTGGGTSCQFAIDQYGNLSLSSGNDCAMISGLSFNASNQIVGYVYDASGNLLSDTSGSNYTWNGNSQLVGFAAQGAGGSYVYDGLLRRVEKTADGVTTVYARDALGDVVASLTNGVWTDYIWADPAAAGDHISATPAAPAAERIAAVVGSGVGTVYYFHADQVGTTRVVTNQAGANVAACGQSPTYPNGSFLTYGPFGMPQGCVQSATPILFTGHELDSESNLSQFQYRKYAALEARWATPDPAGINGPAAPSPDAFDLGPAAAGSPFDLAPESPTASLATLPGFGLANGAVCVHRPQEWNGYSYVGSQPAGARDPTGMFWVRGLPSWRCYGACLGLAQITVYRICRFVVGYWGECAAGVEAAFALLCWERCS